MFLGKTVEMRMEPFLQVRELPLAKMQEDDDRQLSTALGGRSPAWPSAGPPGWISSSMARNAAAAGHKAGGGSLKSSCDRTSYRRDGSPTSRSA
jgi:hypothetical protein